MHTCILWLSGSLRTTGCGINMDVTVFTVLTWFKVTFIQTKVLCKVLINH